MKKNTYFARGLSLIELMVALVIGSILMIGAVSVYVQSRKTFAVNEAVARLQENARYALSMIEPDLRLANHWGLTSDPLMITGTVGNVPMAVGGAAAACGANFPIDLRRAVDGANDINEGSWPLACGANNGVRDTSDLIVIRRAGTESVPADAQKLQVFTTRAGGASRVFQSDSEPAPIVNTPPFGPNAEVHDLIVRAYYIADDAQTQPGLPTLRRKDLVAGPSFQDEEIMPGIENMQVQFGIDLGGPDTDGNGFPDFYTGVPARYVNPGDPLLNTALVVTARIWLLVRAADLEVGFADTNAYSFGNVQNYIPNDGFRRLLVSRTIQVRNTQL
ncbi:MAG TPA: PilW family protein [Steroidobacteraceae bacterium]|nr:PilW family protein [Steroidobacteraceae bacterium]